MFTGRKQVGPVKGGKAITPVYRENAVKPVSFAIGPVKERSQSSPLKEEPVVTLTARSVPFTGRIPISAFYRRRSHT